MSCCYPCLRACIPVNFLSLSLCLLSRSVCLFIDLSDFHVHCLPIPPSLHSFTSLLSSSTLLSPTHPSIQQSIHWWQTLQNTLQHATTHTVTLCNTNCNMLQYTCPSTNPSIHPSIHPRMHVRDAQMACTSKYERRLWLPMYKNACIYPRTWSSSMNSYRVYIGIHRLLMFACAICQCFHMYTPCGPLLLSCACALSRDCCRECALS